MHPAKGNASRATTLAGDMSVPRVSASHRIGKSRTCWICTTLHPTGRFSLCDAGIRPPFRLFGATQRGDILNGWTGQHSLVAGRDVYLPYICVLRGCGRIVFLLSFMVFIVVCM